MDKAMFDVDNSMHNEANTSNNLFEFSPINMNHDERLNMSERKRSRKEVMHDDNAVDEILGQITSKLNSLFTGEDNRKEDSINVFMDVLSCSYEESSFYLESVEWNVELAVSLWLENNNNYIPHKHTIVASKSNGTTSSNLPIDGWFPRDVVIEGLDVNWKARVNEQDGTIYFINITTGECQQQVPKGFADKESFYNSSECYSYGYGKEDKNGMNESTEVNNEKNSPADVNKKNNKSSRSIGYRKTLKIGNGKNKNKIIANTYNTNNNTDNDNNYVNNNNNNINELKPFSKVYPMSSFLNTQLVTSNNDNNNSSFSNVNNGDDNSNVLDNENNNNINENNNLMNNSDNNLSNNSDINIGFNNSNNDNDLDNNINSDMSNNNDNIFHEDLEGDLSSNNLDFNYVNESNNAWNNQNSDYVINNSNNNNNNNNNNH